MWLPQKAIPAMTSEENPSVIAAAVSPAGQVGDLGGDLVDQPARIARHANRFVAAGGAGGYREITAREVPSPGEQLQQRLVGAPSLGRCCNRRLENTPALRGGDGKQTIGFG